MTKALHKNNYFSGQYKEYNVGIEFESLIEDELAQQSELATVTDRERDHLLNKRYSDLIKDQKKRDAEIDAELKKQEENIRLEEEAYMAAKQEAARAANQTRALDQRRSKPVANGVSKSSWLGDNENEWNVLWEKIPNESYSLRKTEKKQKAGDDEDDFETFLESVKARSQSVRTNGMAPYPYSRTGEASLRDCPATGLVSHRGTSGGSVSMPEASSEQLELDSDFEPEFVMAEALQEQVLTREPSQFTENTGEIVQLTNDSTANIALQSDQTQVVVQMHDRKHTTPQSPTSKVDKGSEVSNHWTQSGIVQSAKVSAPTQSHENKTSPTQISTKTDEPLATEVDPFDFDKFLEELDLEE
ncbi:uncharacterized protein LOC119731405 [Patiria miniata]|uniref:Uncharacterized protein n=1 Tax=Patiria miniata TaxID=46514 RepID=A0A914AAV4_PATMI|nr:uncharacterized protein LOC119731405 [Patiria miniata]